MNLGFLRIIWHYECILAIALLKLVFVAPTQALNLYGACKLGLVEVRRLQLILYLPCALRQGFRLVAGYVVVLTQEVGFDWERLKLQTAIAETAGLLGTTPEQVIVRFITLVSALVRSLNGKDIQESADFDGARVLHVNI